jgi:hypothetical protein
LSFFEKIEVSYENVFGKGECRLSPGMEILQISDPTVPLNEKTTVE